MTDKPLKQLYEEHYGRLTVGQPKYTAGLDMPMGLDQLELAESKAMRELSDAMRANYELDIKQQMLQFDRKDWGRIRSVRRVNAGAKLVERDGKFIMHVETEVLKLGPKPKWWQLKARMAERVQRRKVEKAY